MSHRITPTRDAAEAAPALFVSTSPAEGVRLAGPLGAEGHRVLFAASAAETLRLAAQVDPPVILIDHAPPGIDGPDVCAALRKTEGGANAYLLVLTHPLGEGHLVAALHAGADDYLVRPFGPALLSARLRKGVQLALLRRQAMRDREELRRLRGEPARAEDEEPGENRRRAFRVQVADDTGLRLSVADATGQVQPARAVDVSLTGMLLEPSGEADLGWEVGAQLIVELQLGRDLARVSALVHRRHGQRYALVFPNVVVNGEVEPPEGLLRVIVGLERHWRRTRVG